MYVADTNLCLHCFVIIQILNPPKPEHQSMGLALYRDNLTAFVKAIANEFMPYVHTKRISLIYNTTDVRGKHLFEANKLRKICLNLLHHALECTPPGGFITVQLTLQYVDADTDLLIIKITNTKTAQSNDKPPFTFDWYYPSVKELIAVLNGYIEVSSNLLEKGTAFTLQLLVVKARKSIKTGLKKKADDRTTKLFNARELNLRINNILTRQRQLRKCYHSQLTQPGKQEQEEEKPNLFLKQVYQFIEQHLDDPCFSVDKLAAGVAVSTRSLSRKLNVIAGISAHTMIKHYRLKKAAEFLKSGHCVEEVAWKVGFETRNYFSTAFKNFYGLSPTEYVKKSRVEYAFIPLVPMDNIPEKPSDLC